MTSLDQAVETQLNNIQRKTGKSLAELSDLIRSSGLSKHGEIRSMLIEKFGLGYGDANTLVHHALQSDGERLAQARGFSNDQVVDELYAGPKAHLRPIHDRLMAEIERFGPFEIAPKKTYLSLRRAKQFAMIGPPTKTRVEVGLNVKDLPPDPRLLEQPKGSMCTYVVRLGDSAEADDQLFAWLRRAYESAG
jgi:hypothetical protein